MEDHGGHGIPIEALISFHSLERRLFVRMVSKVGVNPSLAMEIIAFWMWLEESGHPDVIRPLLDLYDDDLRPIAIEAKKCINSFPDHASRSSLQTNVDPTTFSARGSPVNLSFANSRRDSALHGITAILNNVCVKIFEDILAKLGLPPLGLYGEGSRRMGETTGGKNSNFMPLASSPQIEGLLNNSVGAGARQLVHRHHNVGMNETLLLSNIVNVRRAIHLNYMQLMASVEQGLSMMGADDMPLNVPNLNMNSMFPINMNPLAQAWRPPRKETPRDERTLFVTFSNGYPLQEDDLRDFFTRRYGPIEIIYIQQVMPGEEPLFARIVFYLQETILLILNGTEKVKFVIKGKHVWARRYIPKKKRRNTNEECN